MRKTRLHLYTLDMKYVSDLSKADDKGNVCFSTGTQGKQTFCRNCCYYGRQEILYSANITQTKTRKMKNDLDFSKMYDTHNRFVGALNFNNMIPVSEEFITQININPSKNDSPKDKTS